MESHRHVQRIIFITWNVSFSFSSRNLRMIPGFKLTSPATGDCRKQRRYWSQNKDIFLTFNLWYSWTAVAGECKRNILKAQTYKRTIISSPHRTLGLCFIARFTGFYFWCPEVSHSHIFLCIWRTEKTVRNFLHALKFRCLWYVFIALWFPARQTCQHGFVDPAG